MGANVLIMAGGTGGHVFPALACAREFQNRGYSVHWLGTPRGIENELVPNAGLPLHLINVTGLRGKSKLSLLKAPFVLLKAVMQARKIIRELKPVCVLGFGGYVTGPGGLAGARVMALGQVALHRPAEMIRAHRRGKVDQAHESGIPPGAPRPERAQRRMLAHRQRLGLCRIEVVQRHEEALRLGDPCRVAHGGREHGG